MNQVIGTNKKSKLGPGDKLFEMLESVADAFNAAPSLQEELKGTQGWINAILGIRTDDNRIQHGLIIKDGQITVVKDSVPKEAEASLVFATEKDLIDYQATDNDGVCRMILASRIRVDGNQALYGYLNYLISLVYGKEDIEAAKIQ